MQGLFLLISPLPSRWWSHISAPGYWGDVGCVVSPHIRCRSHQRLIKIEWGATYGSIDQVLWLPCSIPPYQDVCAGGHYRVYLIAVSHSNCGESQNKSIHSGLLVWDHIPWWIIVGYYEAATTPGLWSHKSRPIQFVLIVNDFVIEYFMKQHALHLLKILEHNYDITT